MIRRQFIKLASLSGATGISSLGALKALRSEPGTTKATTETVTWHVRGFTCITCAVGLESLLHRERGVVVAKATYPQGIVTIQYRPDIVKQDTLRSTIAQLGFSVEEPKV